MVMIKCPETSHAVLTEIEMDGGLESLPDVAYETDCPLCGAILAPAIGVRCMRPDTGRGRLLLLRVEWLPFARAPRRRPLLTQIRQAA